MAAQGRHRLALGSSLDHGYAWVILASCFTMRMLVDAFWSCLGIFFLRWQEDFEVGGSNTAWIGSVFMLVLCSSAPVSSALANRWTYRVVVIAAGILIVSCLFAISMTSSLWQIYIFMPILGIGLGVALQTGCGYFVVFFDKRLALANGLDSAATALGFLSLPPLMELMITSYGWRGALQITSVIMANICVCGALLRNPPQQISKPDFDKKDLKTLLQLDNAKTRSTNSFLKDAAKGFDLSLFKSIRFISQGVVNGLLYGANNTAIIYLIPYAVSVGFTVQDASYLMLGFGISGLVIRSCPIGWVVDKNFISASTLGGIAFALCGLNIIVISLIKDFMVLWALSVVYGVTLGVAASLRMVVVTYAAGSKKKAPGAIAWMLLCEGIGTFACILLMGFLYDISGNYQFALIVSGACVVCLGVNMIADPFWLRCQNWCSKTNSENPENINQTHHYTSLSTLDPKTLDELRCSNV